MNLSCPSCGTKFRVPDGALGDTGRKLRCASCKHVWFQAPLETESAAPAAAPASPEPEQPPVEQATPPAPAATPDGADTAGHADAATSGPDDPDGAPETPVSRIDGSTDGASDSAEPDGTADDRHETAEHAAADDETAGDQAPSDPQPAATFGPGETAKPQGAIPPQNIGPSFAPSAASSDDGQEAPAEPAYDISRVVGPDAAPEEDGKKRRKSKREKKEKRRGSGGKLLLLLLILLVTAALAAFHWRNDVMRMAPASIEYYEMAGLAGAPDSTGLEYRDLAFSVDEQDGHSLLIVSGRLVNTSDSFKRLPELRVEILDANMHTLRDWRFSATAQALGPGDQTQFRTTYPDPPRNGDEVYLMVTFEDVR